jgi:hypothetical protein
MVVRVQARSSTSITFTKGRISEIETRHDGDKVNLREHRRRILTLHMWKDQGVRSWINEYLSKSLPQACAPRSASSS